MPTPSATKRNSGKRQEHADNCRNMQKSNATNNADIKTPIENLRAAECNQLQQTPIIKIGGGGARAARRHHLSVFSCFLMPKCSISGTPRGSTVAYIASKIIHSARKMFQKRFPVKYLEPTCSQCRCRSASMHHFCRCGIDLGWIWDELGHRISD